MKKGRFRHSIFLTMIGWFFLQSPNLWAQERTQFSYLTDLTWASKYMIDGFNVSKDSPVWQFAAKTKWEPYGISLMYWNSLTVDRSRRQFDEHDFFVQYSRDYFLDQRFELNLHGFFDYWFFPNFEPSNDEFGDPLPISKKDGNKYQIGISLPKIFGFSDASLIPSYNIYYLRYWAQGKEELYQGGFSQELLIEFTKAMKPWFQRASYQYGGISGSLNYNHGTFSVDQGLSHSTLSILGGVYALQSIFTASLNYQKSFEETVNEKDETWTTLSFIKKF